MKTKTITKENLPDWDFGDVVIKKFSFADKMRLANMSRTMRVVKDGNKDKVVIEPNDKLDGYAISLMTMGAGIHSIKDDKNYDYILKPHSHIDEKLNFINRDEISFSAGEVLLNEIKDFNKEITEEEKKN